MTVEHLPRLTKIVAGLAALGALTTAGVAAGGAVGQEPEMVPERGLTARVVEPLPPPTNAQEAERQNAEARANPASQPIGLPLPPPPDDVPSDPVTNVTPTGSLESTDSKRPRLPGVSAVSTAPTGGVSVERAVAVSPDEASKTCTLPGIGFTVLYRAKTQVGAGQYLVEVLQPCKAIQNRSFEAPGNRRVIDGVMVYEAESAPGVSWGTTVEHDGTFAMVSGAEGSNADERFEVLRGLGFTTG